MKETKKIKAHSRYLQTFFLQYLAAMSDFFMERLFLVLQHQIVRLDKELRCSRQGLCLDMVIYHTLVLKYDVKGCLRCEWSVYD